MKMLCRLTLAAALAAVLAAPAAAQDKKKAADEKAAMEAWQKAMTPGDGQKKLEPLVGTFDAKVRTWMDPSRPPDDTVGASVNTWVLGDRYVQVKYEGVFLGETFSGIGYTGYDNVSKKYQSAWMDTGSTGMMLATGSFDAAGKVLSLKGTTSDPVTGKPTSADQKISITDNDHYMIELWGKTTDGKTYKMMEIQYTRKK
ncbi:MAG TPA: DUF1579 domain-containing protein [Thermoanaerobaculia bacterium]|jgi:hypothetical protein|nr:DUF1579 domain-containing protein [Thermoanaerobaculia bacterium]